MQAPSRPLVGTSGFSYADWKESFYPAGLKPPERLRWYAGRFPTVEINVTFYRPVAEKTMLAWRDAVPDDFAFTMKAGKPITHYKRLRGCRHDLAAMWEQFAPLGRKLSCVLFQLPPSLKPDADLLRRFLDDAAGQRDKRKLDCRMAVEFRGRRWYEPETFRVLKDAGATAVLHDMPYKGGFWPVESDGETVLKSGHLLMLPEDWLAETDEHFFYLRFHGTVDKKAWQEYGARNLEPWAAIAGRCLQKGKPLYAYFNNDRAAASTRDAECFRSLLQHDGW